LKLIFLSLSLVLTINTAFAVNKVIYGNNGLRTHNQMPLYGDLEDATAAMVANYRLQDGDKSSYSLLTQKAKFCDGEPLNGEQRLAKCSGFLVAEDILVTAGHCVREQYDCEGNSWVFGYDEQAAANKKISKDSVYKCEKILYSEKNIETKVDFAIIKLDRTVSTAQPMSLSRAPLDTKEHLMVIGYPLGTPLKLAINGTVRENSNSYFFTANLDTFHGNSGSPVIGQNSAQVTGLLVRGESDTKFDEQNSCLRIKRCADNSCRGEDVIRISLVTSKLEELGIY
jgi:V8-like Glu-specific endopeptidase